VSSDRISKHQNNCFDTIRHCAAFLVLYSHHHPLSGLKEPTIPKWDTYGFLAVTIFFAIAGYFMPASHAASSGFMPFMARRCRRIFPALIVCSFIIVYVIGSVFTRTDIASYLLSKEQLRNFIGFSAFLGQPIPTVFADFIYKDAIDGSLWTLPVEFAWYIVLGTCLSFSSSWKTAAALLASSAIIVVVLLTTRSDYAFYGVSLSYFALFGVSFATGALLGMTRDCWRPYRLYLVLVSILFLVMLRGRPEIQVLGTASIAILTVIAGSSFADVLIRGRFDISYGVYLYAFPIQQIVINRLTSEFYTSITISAILTALAGTASHFFIERPFLREKPASNRIDSSVVRPSPHAQHDRDLH
jgi:peptidoglycan/LPS O-acetylase OafA/YrhL